MSIVGLYSRFFLSYLLISRADRIIISPLCGGLNAAGFSRVCAKSFFCVDQIYTWANSKGYFKIHETIVQGRSLPPVLALVYPRLIMLFIVL
ncbi:MAG: hypothetical protein LBJ00_09915 [Planctomycetaceae bacterium]|nr:hypothetical protein [Planctomycetaceae bacterium]